MNLERCDRCESAILEDRLASLSDSILTIVTYEGGADGRFGGTYSSHDARLCSTCWDELYEWVFGDDTPDRSDKADPLPLDKLSSSVERQVDELESVLEDLSEVSA